MQKKQNDVSTEILRVLLETDVPLTAYAISKRIKRSIQIVSYHLEQFLLKGIVESDEKSGRNLFYLKPILYDKEMIIAFKDALTPIVKVIASECEDVSHIINILEACLLLFIRSLKEEFLPNHFKGKNNYEEPQKFDDEIKQTVLKRDNHLCQLCETDQKVGVHHIDYNRSNNSLTNLITLCDKCNNFVNGNRNRNHWIKYFSDKINLNSSLNSK